MTTNFSQTAAYIWSLADLLRGDFKQSQYGRVILPFTILRRLECVLEARKPKVLDQVEKLKAMKKLEEDAREKFLLKAAGQSFYNTSPMDLSKLGSSDIKSNLLTYVDSFSKDAREIFEHFRFDEFVGQQDVAGPGTPLRLMIERDEVPSILLWGPPGSGKTTLAAIVAATTNQHFTRISAVSSGVADLRQALQGCAVAGERFAQGRTALQRLVDVAG